MTNTCRYLTLDNRFGLILPPKQTNEIIASAKNASPYESGGTLIGYYGHKCRYAIITQVITPRVEKTFLNRFRCFISGEFLIRKLKEIWSISKGNEYYIGEWHSHPNNSPLSSKLDDDTMYKIMNNDSEDCKNPIMLIIGNSFDNIVKDICVYVYKKGPIKDRLVMVEPIKNNSFNKYEIIGEKTIILNEI